LSVPTPILFVDNPDEVWRVGTVQELVEDPTQPGKHRAIRVLSHTGEPTQFTVDQFAGKLLQFLDGNLKGRIYLIANNTADELKLMTDDLVDDGLVAGNVYSIGTLQMFKLDPSQQNYSAGVTYKLTIPQLSEGQHKFHFKAASVMSPPSWVGAPYSATTQSSWVKFPVVGDVSGPTVVADSPTTNHKPILSLGTGEVPVSPSSGKASDRYDFYINYVDSDGDPPRYHGGLLGYIRVIFNDGTYASDMIPLVPEDQSDSTFYKTQRQFTVSANGLPEGSHKFHFEASDGIVKTRWPEQAQGIDPTANDPVVAVNAKARLSNVTINPPNGDTNTTFAISVKYASPGGQPPLVVGGREQVWVEFDGNTANKFYLTRDSSSGSNFVSGVIYRANKAGLTVGDHATLFKAIDALNELTTLAGPTIAVRSNLNPPTLTEQKVFNTSKPSEINAAASGGKTHTYRYEVKYSDLDGDAPLVLTNGIASEGIKLYIDGNFEAVVTQKTASVTLPNGSPDYTSPVTYYYVRQGSKYQSGSHNYYFEAKDGTSTDAHTVKSSTTSGPTMLAATISLARAVLENGNWVDKDPVIGQRVKITGTLTESPTKPIPGGQRITITISKPDGSRSTLSATGAQQDTGNVVKNQFSFELPVPPNINKTWTITAKWDGNSDYGNPVTAELDIDVKGPTRVIATQDTSMPATSAPVVDMICMPLVSPSGGDAGLLYGFDSIGFLQIVRWDPEERTYLWYGDMYFPALGPGAAAWILPSPAYPAESIDPNYLPQPVDPNDPNERINTAKQYRLLKPYGTIWSQTTDCEITLKQGWNQIGSPFLLPSDIRNAKVKYQGTTVSINEAANSGWIRNYAWMWNPETQKADTLIHPTRSDARRYFEPWRGYWIRALANCTLVLAAPAANMQTASVASISAEEAPRTMNALATLDEPPSAPIGPGR
jgi:hypothetical protein